MKESVPFVTEAGTVTLPKGTYIATLLRWGGGELTARGPARLRLRQALASAE